MLCVPSTPYPHCLAWLMYQGGQLFVFFLLLLRLGEEFHSLRENARGAQAPRDTPRPLWVCDSGPHLSLCVRLEAPAVPQLSLPLQLDPVSLEPLS